MKIVFENDTWWYEFLPLLSGKTAYVSVKDLIANTVGCGLALALVHRGV